LAATLLAGPAWAEAPASYFASYRDYNDEGKKILDGLDIKTGKITLEEGVTLSLPPEFYFLDKSDAGEVLVGIWHNPADTLQGTMGMIFPRKYDPLMNDAWGIELSFDKIGYVEDKYAASTNYEELLAGMKSDLVEQNPERETNGFDPITLVGWASPPTYDAMNKRLPWAKELQFGTSAEHTLNYNVRFLGREGVFVMNYIAGMKQLPEIKLNLDPVLSLVSFNEGKKYSDFTPGMDTVAAVGIGGLIAGKIAAKAGLLALGLVFIKKFFFLVLVPVLWLGRKIKGLFSKGEA
jgi:uncharacterized membrane-anchored protein